MKNTETPNHVREFVCDDALSLIYTMLIQIESHPTDKPFEIEWKDRAEQWLSYARQHGKKLFSESAINNI